MHGEHGEGMSWNGVCGEDVIGEDVSESEE